MENKKPRRIREYIYWGIFLFIAIVMANIINDVILATFSEETSFSESTAINKKREVRTARIETNLGSFTVVLNRSSAPVAVNNFAQQSLSGFYDGTKIHRVVKGLLIQGGDPLSREDDRELYGTGGSSYVFEDENTSAQMRRGVIAMANKGRPNTNGSQFFVLVADEAPLMQGNYTIFGSVVEGMDVVDRISAVEVDEQKIPVEPVIIKEITVE